MHRPHAGMTSLKTMFGLAPRKKTRRLPTWSDVLRSIGQTQSHNNPVPRRMQDRSKYGPHNGKREKARRRAGGFHALRRAEKHAVV